jgi:hypothetical protein
VVRTELADDVTGTNLSASDDPTPPATAPEERRSRNGPLHSVSVMVLVLVIAVTSTLAITAFNLHDSNEKRLLSQRAAEAAAVLGVAVPALQTPLASGAVLAEATAANRAEFTTLMTPLSNGRMFVSVSIWSATASDPRALVVVGQAPEFANEPVAARRALLARATAKPVIAVNDLLGAAQRRLGYAYAAGPSARYVVYAESALPQNRRAAVDSNTAFADVDYAIYLSESIDSAHLLASSADNPKFDGRTADATVAFGDTKLRIVLTPRRELGGDLLARLPWLIAVVGAVIALAATWLTERLVRGREHAEDLAHQNAMLFSEQRSVARTLQHSLLPDEEPRFPGLELAARYVPGVDGVDIGGDWYDVIDIDEQHVMLVVGDVSGRGLRAATVMAALRYATRAYAAQGDGPELIVSKLSNLIDVGRDGQFATTLCGLVDVGARTITLANAGHPNPLLIAANSADFIPTHVGLPVGVALRPYVATTVTIPAGGVLLAFTDGLFERRGESIDDGLARLRDAAVGYSSLDELLDGLLQALTPNGGDDDVAALAVRWVL